MSSEIQTVSLEQLEALVYAGRYEQAAPVLVSILEDVGIKGVEFSPSVPSDSKKEQNHQRLQINTRIAAATAGLFAAKNFQLSQTGYWLLMTYKHDLRKIFMASGFGGMDYLHWHIVEHDTNGRTIIKTKSDLLKMLLAVTLDSPQDIELYRHWIKNLPLDVVLPFWLSFIDADIVLGEQADRVRKAVASMFHEIEVPENFRLSPAMVLQVVCAWMLTSYMGYEEKHQPKKFLNQLLRQYGEKSGVTEPVVEFLEHKKIKDKQSKPRMVVALERFTSSHAMHRCYRRSIDSLREYFYVIGLCDDRSIDDDARLGFDEVHTFPKKEPLADIARRVVDLRPSLIYYPSLGMKTWSVVLAQFRFAPIQIMTLGHPATSMSPTIDYVIAGETNPELFSERVVFTGQRQKPMPVPHPAGDDFTYCPQNNGKVRIGINAKLYKINHRLIKACQEIQEQSHAPVEFIFFPACVGITLDAFKNELSRHLSATVYPSTDYPTFIDRLRTCDMVLNPFPFGNTNGIYDCARIGLPFVCMNGEEPHSQVDVVLSEHLGYPEFLRTETLDEYIQAAIKLVDNKALRSEISQGVLSRHDEAPDNEVSRFGEMAYKIYCHHNKIQQSDDRLIDIDTYPLPDELG